MSTTRPTTPSFARSTNGAGVPRRVRQIERALTPDDVVPRLVALGIPSHAAGQLADVYSHDRITDALDAVEVLDARRPVRDPIGWVDAAVKQRWDVSALLARRREDEARLAARDADLRQRREGEARYPDWRAIADRWDTAISTSLDNDQLATAIEAVTAPVPGIGRRSVAVTRAELVAWAVDVHTRRPDVAIGQALADDLAAAPEAAVMPGWPLPEPPPVEHADLSDAAVSLSDRISRVFADRPELAGREASLVEVTIPDRQARLGRDLER